MSRTLAASDRSSLIRLASSLPKGSVERKAILAGLKVAMEHASPEALKQYLKDHPNADPKNHTVKKEDAGKAEKDAKHHVDGILGRDAGENFKRKEPKLFGAFSEALARGGAPAEAALDIASVMDEGQQKKFTDALKRKSPYDAAAEVLGDKDPELLVRADNLKKHKKVDVRSFDKANSALQAFYSKHY